MQLPGSGSVLLFTRKEEEEPWPCESLELLSRSAKMLSWALGPSAGFFFLATSSQWRLVFTSGGEIQKSFFSRRVEQVDQGSKKSVHTQNSLVLMAHKVELKQMD